MGESENGESGLPPEISEAMLDIERQFYDEVLSQVAAFAEFGRFIRGQMRDLHRPSDEGTSGSEAAA